MKTQFYSLTKSAWDKTPVGLARWSEDDPQPEYFDDGTWTRPDWLFDELTGDDAAFQKITPAEATKLQAKPTKKVALSVVEAVKSYSKVVGGKAVRVGGYDRKGELHVPKLGGNVATRVDDKRTSQGQTRTNFTNEHTGAPMGKTESGDTFEQLFIAKGKQLVEHRYGKVELVTGAGGGTSRTTALDLRTRSHGGELKSMSSLSSNLKTAIKKDEIDRKLMAVATEKLKPLLLVQVVDQQNHTVNLYGMENFGSKAVSKMEHFGEFKYTAADFRKAQEKSGHGSKAVDRALTLMTPQARAQFDAYIAQGLTPAQAIVKMRSTKQGTYVHLSAEAIDEVHAGTLTLAQATLLALTD